MGKPRPPIPAPMKRQVLVEAGHRCAIPTCRDAANIDVHHIVPWEKCLKHEADNLIALCPSCHRLAHDGKIDRKSLKKYKEICQKLAEPPAHHDNNSVHAYLKFNPNTATGILDAKNILALYDHGTLNFSVRFSEGFKDDTYVVNAVGDGSVSFRVIEKGPDVIQVLFSDPCPNVVRLEFRY